MTEYNFDVSAVDVVQLTSGQLMSLQLMSVQDALVMASEGTDFNHTLEPQ